MEEIMEQISRYHRWSIGCLIGMIFGGIVTGILYRELNIKEVVRFFKRRRNRMLVLMSISLLGCPSFSATAAQLLEVQVLPGSELEGNELIKEGENLYYVKNLKDFPDIKINLKILDEENLISPDTVYLEYRIEGMEEWTFLTDETAEWINSADGQFEITYSFDGIEDITGVYEFRCSYMDIEGQKAVISLPGNYVIDKVAPSFETRFTSKDGEALEFNEDGNSLEPYYNAADEMHWLFQVFEENLDMEQTSVSIIISDRNGQVLKENQIECEDNRFSIILNEDGHYQAKAILTDKSGNQTIYENCFALDSTAPKEANITYYLENGNILSRIFNKITFGYFAKEKLIARIQVEDAVSGVDKITYTYRNVENAETISKSVEALQNEENKNIFQTEVELPYSFKGNLQVYSIDRTGNISEEQKDIGVIAESEDTHVQTSRASIEIPASGTKQNQYFNTDVPVNFFVQDQYSGIQKISYVAGTELQETVFYTEEKEIITEQVEKNYIVSAAANEGNNIRFGLAFTDNAGHTTVFQEEELPVIHIDITKPKIQVVYDNNEVINGKYYNAERTATISVTEKNFDPEDVAFSIEGGEVEIGAWHQEDNQWHCNVRFYRDGEYRFGFSCTDLAGNTGTYERVDEFVIDQTIPTIHVVYDNYDVKNNFYYKTPRTATLIIREKNFSALS